MDIPSLLNPAKPNISSRDRNVHSNLHDIRSVADLSYPLETSIKSDVLKKCHSPRVEGQKLGVTRQGSFFNHCCERLEVNEPLARLHLSNKDFNHGGRPLLVAVSPGYASLAFSNSDDISTLPTVEANPARLRTTGPRQDTTVEILPPSSIEGVDTHSYRVESRSTGSSISSPSSLVGLRGSPVHSPCSMAAESSTGGSRSIFSASPPEYGHLSSPTNSLIAFASVAVGDYGFMNSGNPRTAGTTADKASALTSSVDSMFGNQGLFYREPSTLSFGAVKRGDGESADRLLTERMATIHASSQADNSPAVYCVSPRSQFRESFERTHCQGYVSQHLKGY